MARFGHRQVAPVQRFILAIFFIQGQGRDRFGKFVAQIERMGRVHGAGVVTEQFLKQLKRVLAGQV